MTYRLVPPHVWARLQKALLGVTAIIGLGIALAPLDKDARLTAIETTMNVDLWAYSMILSAVIAFGAELYMSRRHSERLINLVAACHIVMCSLLCGYATSAGAGVLTRTWWNFGAPVIGFFLAYLHYIFVRRRPHAHL